MAYSESYKSPEQLKAEAATAEQLKKQNVDKKITIGPDSIVLSPKEVKKQINDKLEAGSAREQQ